MVGEVMATWRLKTTSLRLEREAQPTLRPALHEGMSPLCVIIPLRRDKMPVPTKPDGSPTIMPPHITVLYTTVPTARVDLAREILSQGLVDERKFVIRLNRHDLGRFGNCVWAAPRDVKGRISSLHHLTLALLRGHGFQAEQTHNTFVPHATLGYKVEGKAVDLSGFQSHTIRVGQLQMWVGDHLDMVFNLI